MMRYLRFRNRLFCFLKPLLECVGQYFHREPFLKSGSLIFIHMLICYGLLVLAQLYTQSTITFFLPVSGTVGTSVTITGIGFDTTQANNFIFFGATQTEVTSATTTELILPIPAGATCQTINIVLNHQGAPASSPFLVSSDDPKYITLASRSNLKGSNRLISTVLMDLGGERKPDMVIANSDGSTVSILKNLTVEIGTNDSATKIDKRNLFFPQV